jgi:proton glutamate symport protein
MLPYSEKIISIINTILKSGAKIFLNMIKMLIAPLVFSTLVVGIAGHGNIKSLGKIGTKTIIYFLAATFIALIIGLLAANIGQPGKGCIINYSQSQLHELETIKEATKAHSPADTFVHMVPTSVVDAMAQNQILQVVVFSIFFSFALGSIGEKGKPVLAFIDSLSKVMFKFTEYVMKFAPMGVFCAIAATIGQQGPGILVSYLKLIACLYIALFIFLSLVLFTVCAIIKIPFLNLLWAIKDPALLAFSTATSEAALPKAMETMEEFGVPKKIVAFVMPTGYTFNLDGSTLYLSLAAIFLAQMYNIELSLWQQILMMLTLMLSSKGMAAVPRVALVILAGTLGSFGIPVAGLAVLLGIDHILDMGRTTVNLIGNCVATVVVARWENVFDDEKMHEYMEDLNELKAAKALRKSSDSMAKGTIFNRVKGSDIVIDDNNTDLSLTNHLKSESII